MKKVIIIGGGVAGMSAAHELVDRGFEVEIYDRNQQYVGGKARSVNVPGTNKLDPNKYLPGEHGFRFFPGFYQHITDTMKRIPFQRKDNTYNKNGCYDNLIAVSKVMLARNEKNPIITLARFPKSLKDYRLIFRELLHGADTGLTQEEKHFFEKKMWQLVTSCQERFDVEYEKLGWAYYLEAMRFSQNYRDLLVAGFTRTLVAAQARSASTRTGGTIFLQLIYNILDPTLPADRILNGPSNDQWLIPWHKYLQSKGVKYFLGHEAVEICMKDNQVENVKIKYFDNNLEKLLQAKGDYYLLATPVERTAILVNSQMIDVDSNLCYLKKLAKKVSWMNGIQYYLKVDVPISPGHVIYTDSEWALTSISQIQFWGDYDLLERYDGSIKGILSVDISDWEHTTYKGVLAKNCDAETVARYVYEQIRKSLNIDGKNLLPVEMNDIVAYWYLDRDIQQRTIRGEIIDSDKEPLLVNTTNSRELMPESYTQIANLFIAADYVRTNTGLATMEAANEAGRRAVNSIIDRAGGNVPYSKIWKLRQPMLFRPLKWYDNTRLAKGLPYSEKTPWWLNLLMVPWIAFSLIVALVKVVLQKIF